MFQRWLSKYGRYVHFAQITERFAGKSVFFALFFAFTGFGLACKGKLTDSYALLVTAIQGFIVWRSVQQDKPVQIVNNNEITESGK